MRRIALLGSAFWGALANPVAGMDFSSTFVPASPMLPSSIRVEMSGEIIAGDSKRLLQELGRYDLDQVEIISFSIDSPGGSLSEGLMLGKIIASLDDTKTYSSIPGSSASYAAATCASACVYAFLGATYRSMGPGAQIGVHKFYTTADGLTSDAAISAAQTLSGEIVEFLRDRDVDVDFFNDILKAEGSDIHWVPRERLQQVRVLNDGVSASSAEYHNVNGELSLRVEQKAAVGRNVLRFSCGDGLIGVAFLMEPPMAMPTKFFLTIGGQQFYPEHDAVISRENHITTVVFKVGEELSQLLARVGSVGAGVYTGPDIFYGFSGEIADRKISEMATSCPAPSQPVRSAPEFVRGVDVDIAGGDLTSNGIRGITMDRCEQICLGTPNCVGVSYVLEKKWCWPKSSSGRPVARRGVMSSMIDD